MSFSETAEAASNIAQLGLSLSLLFCGVLAPGTQLGWWIWMYRVSPFTYVVGGMLSAAIGGTDVTCDSTEYTVVQPPAGLTCGQYLDPFIAFAHSNLENREATADCRLCAIASTDQFLAALGINVNSEYLLPACPPTVADACG